MGPVSASAMTVADTTVLNMAVLPSGGCCPASRDAFPVALFRPALVFSAPWSAVPHQNSQDYLQAGYQLSLQDDRKHLAMAQRAFQPAVPRTGSRRVTAVTSVTLKLQ